MRECSPKKGMTKGHLLAIKPWVFFFFKSSFYRSGQQNDMINKIEYFYKCKCHLQQQVGDWMLKYIFVPNYTAFTFRKLFQNYVLCRC